MKSLIFNVGAFLVVLWGSVPATEAQTNFEETTVAEKWASKPSLHSFDLESLPAPAAEMTLQKLFPDVVFSADSVSNTLYFRSDETVRDEILEFVEKADRKAMEKEMMQKERERLQEVDLRRRADEERMRQQDQLARRETLILRLQNISPVSVQNVLRELELNAKVNASVSGNALVLTATDAEDLDRVVELAKELDVPQDSVATSIMPGVVRDKVVPGYKLPGSATPGAYSPGTKTVPGYPIPTPATGQPIPTPATGYPIPTPVTGQLRTGVPLPDAKASPPVVMGHYYPPTARPSKAASPAAQLEAFRVRQSALRRQIELQREKLKMLEQRLEAREKEAEAYFKSITAVEPASNATMGLFDNVEIDIVPDTSAVTIRGKEADVKKVVELVEKIEERAKETSGEASSEQGDLIEESLESDTNEEKPSAAGSLFDTTVLK